MTDHVTLRTISSEEVPDFLRAVELAFSESPTEEEIAHESSVTEPDRSLVAMDGAGMVGTAGAFSRELTIPGGTLPMAAVTMVGVVATHRRQGILRMLMRRQLEDVRERGEVVAGLTASEGAIYGRFGYGIATLSGRFHLDKRTAVVRGSPSPQGRIELVPLEEALQLMPIPFDRVRRTVPGMLARTPVWWEYVTRDLERWRDGASALLHAVHRTADEVDGYVSYRFKHDWSEGVPEGSVIIQELMAATPEAYADLWRYVLGIDLAGRVEGRSRPSDEPLLHLLAEPRRLRLQLGDGLWIRLVDVPRALEARRYRTDGRVVLEVRDEFCPANHGRYELEGGPDGAICRPTDADPDLELAVEDLGAAYLGGTSFDALARAGRVRILQAGAEAGADAMFGTARAPWCPNHF
jgi:predicted acetyltransferase